MIGKGYPDWKPFIEDIPFQLRTTRADYRDIELRARLKLSADANSGIILRRKDERCVEIELNTGNDHPGDAIFWGDKRWTFARVPKGRFPNPDITVVPDQWFDLRVYYVGDDLKVYIDDRLAYENTVEAFDDEGPIAFWQVPPRDGTTSIQSIEVRRIVRDSRTSSIESDLTDANASPLSNSGLEKIRELAFKIAKNNYDSSPKSNQKDLELLREIVVRPENRLNSLAHRYYWRATMGVKGKLKGLDKTTEFLTGRIYGGWISEWSQNGWAVRVSKTSHSQQEKHRWASCDSDESHELAKPNDEIIPEYLKTSYSTGSADGHLLYYHDSSDGKMKSWDSRTPQQPPKELTSYRVHGYPVVSPDGTMVAYPDNKHLVIRSLDTRDILVKHSLPDWKLPLPGWSADSRYVAFGGNGGEDVGLWVIHVETGEAKKVLEGKYTRPRWSPNGEFMSAEDRSKGIVDLFCTDALSLPGPTKFSMGFNSGSNSLTDDSQNIQEVKTVEDSIRREIATYHEQLIRYLEGVDEYFDLEENKARKSRTDALAEYQAVQNQRNSFANTTKLPSDAQRRYGSRAPDVPELVNACEEAISEYVRLGADAEAASLKQSLDRLKKGYPASLLDKLMGRELVANGRFDEVGQGSRPTSWVIKEGPWEVVNRPSSTGEMGKHIFAGVTARGEIEQIVPLEQEQTASSDWVILSALLTTYTQKPSDRGELILEFLKDESSPPLETIKTPETESPGKWTPMVLLAAVPEEAKFARVRLVAKRYGAGTKNNDAQFDDVSLRFLSKANSDN